MNLAIDIGNTRAKAALFTNGRIVERLRFVAPEGFASSDAASLDAALADWVRGIAERNPQLTAAIVVSTRGRAGAVEKMLLARLERVVILDHTTPTPVKNLYATPETLGLDRLAAAVGAGVLFPSEVALMVDFGTAITFDVVTAAGEFLGGTISPGAATRFRALYDYTGSLPLVALPEDDIEFPPRDTHSAIAAGVTWGIVAETEAAIERAKRNMGDIRIIFTGGDAEYFAGRVNYPIFATSDLVFYGLNAILDHNAITHH